MLRVSIDTAGVLDLATGWERNKSQQPSSQTLPKALKRQNIGLFILLLYMNIRGVASPD